MFSVGGGSTTVAVSVGAGCAWSVSTDSPAWVTLNGGTGNGNGSFVLTAAVNLGQARLGTIIVGKQSFKVMEGGSVPIFNDVLPTAPYFDYISLMSSYGVTAGCQANPPLYCPDTPVTRAQMAVFIVSVLDNVNHAAGSVPPLYTQTPYFQDVPSSAPFFPFMQRLRDLNITNGCKASPPLYCPDTSITQSQMAKFMILGWMQRNGLSTFTYTQTPYFTDVLPSDILFSYVQKMRDLGFWTGCSATQYCPASSVTRAQMAPLVMRSLFGAP